jgi:soluble lytic murein transglycosylase
MPRMPNTTRLRTRLLVLAMLLTLVACDAAELVPTRPTPAPSAASPPAPPLTMAEALALRALADDTAAAEAFHALLDAAPAGPDARAARLYLGESLGRAGRWSEAGVFLQPLATDGVRDELAARASFLLGRVHEEAGAWAEAAAAYEAALLAATPLEPYVRLRQAAVLRALGRDEEAAAAYEAVATSSIARLQRAAAYEGAITTRLELGQPGHALALYRALFEFAEQPAYRAQHLLDAARLAETQGEPDQARVWRHEAAISAPDSVPALGATTLLLADPQGTLAPADAARVYAAHEHWDDALVQFDAALASDSTRLDLRRERALVLRAQGDYQAALAELAAVSAADPDGETGRQARLDWVQTLGQSGDLPAAIEGYRQFAAAYPEDQRAPEALRRAIILLDQGGDAAAAAEQRLVFARGYPSAEGADRALFLAGLYFFEDGRADEASTVWEELRRASSGVVAAQAQYWQARAAADDPADASPELLEAARATSPDSYYATRAAELLGAEQRGTLAIGGPVTAEEWQAAERWLAEWSGAAPERIAAVQESIVAEPAAERALALAGVAQIADAVEEWRVPLDAWRDDPLRLYHAARAAYDGGLPYVALNAAERLVALSPDAGTASEPLALRKLIYPTPYRQIVIEQAGLYGLDPLALYALLRQESHFNPAATSWVGAQGLAQVMPSTAAGIAEELGVREFEPGDLHRPDVGVRFGAFYLRRQLDTLDGSLPGALAAYNAGAGNALRWAGEGIADPDLFAERIDFGETRTYVKNVYGAYGVYRRMYRSG